LFVC